MNRKMKAFINPVRAGDRSIAYFLRIDCGAGGLDEFIFHRSSRKQVERLVGRLRTAINSMTPTKEGRLDGKN